MMTDLLARLVKRSPRLEQLSRRVVALRPYASRQHPAFWEFYRQLADTEYAGADVLRELQQELLLETVRRAYAGSGFYRRLYDAHGVDVKSLRSAEDVVARVPVVEKAMLRVANDLTVPHAGMTSVMTSGTSGTPFVFQSDPRSAALEQAAIFHQWKKAGFVPGTPRVEMRAFQTEAMMFYPDAAVTRFSVVNMDAHMERFVEYLNRTKTAFLHGYPSALAKFGLLLRDRGLSLDYPLRGIFLASEPVYEWQTDIIDSVLHPQSVVAHYGTAERTVLGAWCENVRSYHMLPLYGFMETGTDGEIIGTGFVNCATPFVRYRSSDTALSLSASPCVACGRSYAPVVGQIGGRMEDYLVDEKDELIPPAVVTFPFKDLRAIEAVQIVQDERRDVLLRCVVRTASAQELSDDRSKLTHGLHRMLGASIDVRFEYVDAIPLTQNGKFRWIISNARKVVSTMGTR